MAHGDSSGRYFNVASICLIAEVQTVAGWSWVSEQIAAVNVLATPTVVAQFDSEG